MEMNELLPEVWSRTQIEALNENFRRLAPLTNFTVAAPLALAYDSNAVQLALDTDNLVPAGSVVNIYNSTVTYNTDVVNVTNTTVTFTTDVFNITNTTVTFNNSTVTFNVNTTVTFNGVVVVNNCMLWADQVNKPGIGVAVIARLVPAACTPIIYIDTTNCIPNLTIRSLAKDALQAVWIVNLGPNQVILKHEDTTGGVIANERFNLPNNADYTLSVGEGVGLHHDDGIANDRWHCLDDEKSTGSGGGATGTAPDIHGWHHHGNWYGWFLGTKTTAGTVPAGTYYAGPFLTTQNITASRIGAMIGNSDGLAAHNVRLGIYTNTSATVLYPNALLFDSGPISIPAGTSTPVATSVVCTQNFSGGLYWFVLVSDDPNITVIGTSVTFDYGIVGAAALGSNPSAGYQVAQAYGAFVGTFPGGATVLSPFPAIQVQV